MVKSIGMDAFTLAIRNMAFILLAAAAAAGLFLLYNRLPPAWFMEHPSARRSGEAGPEPAEYPDSRMRKSPDGVLFGFAITLVSFLFFLQYGYSLLLICNTVPLLFFAMIFAADLKTGIIPDPFVVGLIFSSLFWIAYDISVLVTARQPLYYAFIGRIPAALCGGAVIWLIGKIGSLLLKEDAMGMGDVKLVFACGLIVDFAGIFWIIGLSFLLAFIPAILGMIFRKRGAAVPPSWKRGRLPFAPFIIAAAVIYMLFPTEFAMFAAWYGF